MDRFGRGRAFRHLLPVEHQPLIQRLQQRLTFFLADAQAIFAAEVFVLDALEQALFAVKWGQLHKSDRRGGQADPDVNFKLLTHTVFDLLR